MRITCRVHETSCVLGLFVNGLQGKEKNAILINESKMMGRHMQQLGKVGCRDAMDEVEIFLEKLPRKSMSGYDANCK